ncbi:hypothetical protein [Chitinophaga eiseniae]|uniref:Uncharacterized protein n=1 Tax=Chitinophaga eiseniae TaxID=634771 RepID=A0A847SJX2_9BACT|nr:hypothetical protein [Chitinophaga eiseniae]NLR79077.1 hypothetical protein [Chitinophaga eiseniae]
MSNTSKQTAVVSTKNEKSLAEKIVESMVASFSIEGITISPEQAAAVLKKRVSIEQTSKAVRRK